MREAGSGTQSEGGTALLAVPRQGLVGVRILRELRRGGRYFVNDPGADSMSARLGSRMLKDIGDFWLDLFRFSASRF